MLPVLLKQHAYIDNLMNNSVFFKSENLLYYRNLLDFISNNLELDIYTIHTLKNATKISNLSELYEIVRFFSGGNSNLFEVKYIYEGEDGDIAIPYEEYARFIANNEIPVDENGCEIEDFDPKYLTFYCLVNYDE